MNTHKVLDNLMLSNLIKAASDSDIRRARINFHPSDDSTVQEMLICAFSDTKINIHGHYNKSESFCVLSGCLDVFLFETERPVLIERIELRKDVNHCYYRLDGTSPHLVVPRSDPTIFLETTAGPFVKGGNSYIPAWGPNFDVTTFLTEFYGHD